MSVYLVTGRTGYRGHQTNATFEANLEKAAEVRAIRRGAIVLLERSQPSLKAGSYKLPRAQARPARDTPTTLEAA